MQIHGTNEAVVAFSAGLDVLTDKYEIDTSALPQDDLCLSAHSVYNFEVAGTHTYIADGVRVHNRSVLSFLNDNQRLNISRVEDNDKDGDVDFAVVSIPGSTTEIEVTLLGETGDSQEALFEMTTADADGNLIYSTFKRDSDGNIIPGSEEQKYLVGQHFGAAVGGALTPFLTAAFLGEDASVFEEVAADTVIGTVLENVGEVIGAFVHRAALDQKTFSFGENLDKITELSFQDFGGELVVNAVENSISVVNQLIMAEIFESLELDGVSGVVFDTIVGTGLNSLLTSGADYLLETDFIIDLFSDLGFSTESINTIRNYSGSAFPTDVAGFASIFISKLLNEFLPAIETVEGQIASAITQAGLAAFGVLDDLILAGVNVGGPIGVVVGWIVGKIFDSLFEKEPEAWSNVGFDAETGRFVLLGTWENDGGNTQISTDLAQTYLDGMNGFIDTLMAQSHNYDQLGQWTFGHLEDALKNAGASGQTFADFQATYVNALITDMSNADVLDGRMAAVRVLEQGIEGQQLRHVVNDYKFYENFATLLETVRDANYDTDSIDPSLLQLDFQESLIVSGTTSGTPGNRPINLSRTNGPDLGNYENFREFLKAWHDYLDPVRYISYRRTEGGDNAGEEWDSRLAQSDQASALQARLSQILAISDFQTLEDFIRPENYQFDQLSDENLDAISNKYEALTSIVEGIGAVQNTGDPSLEVLQLDFQESLIVRGTTRGSPNNYQINLSRTNGPDLGDYVNFREFLKAWHDYLDPIRYISYRRTGGGDNAGEEWDSRLAQSDEASGLQAQISLLLKLNFLTLEDFLVVASPIRLPAPPFVVDNLQAYNILSTNLQIADDFHTYLENREAIDDLIALSPNSALSAGWVATLLTAEEMGLNAAYELTGDAIDNLFYTADGDDVVYGLDGNDTITTYGGADIIGGGSGEDSIDSGSGADTIYGAAQNDTIHSGSGDDVVFGGTGQDLIYLDDGDDVFNDNAETQLEGSDTVWAGQGDDTVNGSGGDDNLFGQDGNDSMLGGVGNDSLWGSSGDDTIKGDAGNDVVGGGAGSDSLGGNSGDDEIWGGAGADTIWAGSGDDSLDGGNGSDQLTGGKGNDQLEGGKGDDFLTGGDDADTFIYYGDTPSGNDTISDFEVGIDILRMDGYVFSDLTISEIGNDVFISWENSSITLSDIELNSVTADVFVFV